MDINYKITQYFNENELFDNNKSNGILIKKNDGSMTIKGNSRDLVEFADLLVSVAASKEKGAHIHVDNLTLLNTESDFSEIIIEKSN